MLDEAFSEPIEIVPTASIDANAASTTASVIVTGLGNAANTGSPAGAFFGNVLTVNVFDLNSAVGVEISGTYNYIAATNGNSVITMSILRDGVAMTGGSGTFSSGTMVAGAYNSGIPFSIIGTDSPPPGNHTYQLVGQVTGGNGSGAAPWALCQVFNSTFKCRVYKR